MTEKKQLIVNLLPNIYEQLGVPELDPAYELIKQQRAAKIRREAAWARGEREDPND